MKNIYIKQSRILLFAVLISSFLFSGCKKYLSPEPVSSFSEGFAFSNLPYAKSAVIGVYNSFAAQTSYGLYFSMYYPYDTDEMMGAGGATVDGERRDIARYNLTSTNTGISAAYSSMYTGIERANICIEQIPKMDLYNNGSATEKGELKRLHGEALTLRAEFYLDLVRNWGDLPEQRIPSSEMPSLFLPKTDRDSIYDHVLNDLKVAETLVPWRTEISQLGDAADERITKGAVKALRARIALTRGGYSLRRATTAMGRSADYVKYYQIARDECADIMARRDQHTLNSSYKAVWKDYVCGRNANEPNGELMFQIAEGGNGTGSADGRIGIYNGTKVGSSSNGALSILPTYYYAFDSTDVRRDVTGAPYETKADLITRVGHSINNFPDGKFRREWWSNPVNPTNATLNSGINWILIRFSDVLLMFAEADNELNHNPSADAIAAVSEVSKRAHGGSLSLVPPIPTDYTGFFKYLVRERFLEFGDEGIRKYDLIRWNLLGTAIAETKVNLAHMGATVPLPMNAPSYMASPAPYCLSASLPMFMYYFNNATADDSKIWINSLYKPAPAAVPVGTTRVNWVGYSAFNTTYTNIFASAFRVNHSELLPIYNTIIAASRGTLTQDYGY
jgi:hypothetical protein